MCLTARAIYEKMRQDPLVCKLWSGRQPKELNREQNKAMVTSMLNKFQLIQGPPGDQIYCVIYTLLIIQYYYILNFFKFKSDVGI